MNEFYTLLTNYGIAKIVEARANKQTINLSHIAVGDAEIIPSESMSALKSEKHRLAINSIIQDENNPSYLIIEGVIPVSVGGFYINEVGIFDESGNLFAIGNLPKTYKPLLSEGSAKDLTLKITIEVANASEITLKVDNSVVLATRSWAENLIKKKEDKGVAKTLDDALKQEIAGNYLLKTETAADSDKLDGKDSSEFALKSDIANATEAKAGIVKLKNSVTGKAEDVAVTEKAIVDYMKKEISINGNATFDNVKNNIVMSGIGSIALAVGDVIEVKGTSSNDKLFTVESIVSNDEIIVNYEHRGTSTPIPSKRLIKETTQNCVIKLYCRAKDAPLGLGQGWCVPASGRGGNINYPNNTQRTIAASFYVGAYSLAAVSIGVYLDEIAVSAMMTNGTNTTSSSATLVPPNSVLKVSTTPNRWTELR